MPDFSRLKIALAPLDERPVNTRYPQMLGAIAGADVVLPPAAIMSRQRIPADIAALGAWLRDAAGDAEAVVASTELLAYGSLIASRISEDSAADTLQNLRPLEEIGAGGTPVYAFSVITRVSNADDSVEEPLYWSEWGTLFYRYSALLHRREAGMPEPGDEAALRALEAQLPPDIVDDWLHRRLRNHAVNLALIDMLARGRLSFLLITSDDTSPWGTPSREKAWLESWMRVLGPRVSQKMMMHPGADEVGSALTARLICAQRGIAPRIFPDYAISGDEEIVAPYEDRAVRLTVEGQIRACGGVLADSAADADIVLGVLTPSPRRTEFRADFADAERAAREGAYRALFARLGELQAAGIPVALGDVAYPNGSDPLAIDLLLEPDCPLEPARLSAYGAWNTAGNTLGVVVAQAICSLFINGNAECETAQRVFLTHRFLEDWGYQAVVRSAARTANRASWGGSDPDPDSDAQVEATCACIELGLREALARLQKRGVGAGLSIAPGSIRLPWRRTFEADFDLIPA